MRPLLSPYAAMGSIPEASSADLDTFAMSSDLLSQFQRTMAETSPGQMQADLQTILAASMHMAPMVPSFCRSQIQVQKGDLHSASPGPDHLAYTQAHRAGHACKCSFYGHVARQQRPSLLCM